MQCDRKKPSCSQCLKTSRECTGYRHAIDLVLRDKSHEVAQQYAKASLPTMEHETDKSRPSRNGENIGFKSAIIPASALGHKDRAAYNHLFHNLVLTQQITPSSATCSVAMFTKTFKDSAYLDYLPTLLLSPKPSPILNTCLEAVSLMYCSQQKSKSSLLPQARATFQEATRKVREAISQTADVSSDDLLASVMLLALLAILSPDTQSELGMWDVHFKGAIALLHARSPETLQGKALQNILSQILNLGAMHAFQMKKPMSPQLLTCLRYSLQLEYSVQVQFWELLVKITELQHLIKERRYSDPEIIERLISIDTEIKAYYEAIVQGHDEDRVWKTYGHENDYPLHRRLQPLNNLRVARMRLNELIYIHAKNCIGSNKHNIGQNNIRLNSQTFTAAKVVQTMAEQIYRSVPDLFRPGHSTKEFPYNLNAWICSFVWPLAEVMHTSTVCQQLRDSTADQLKWFSKISCNESIIYMASESFGGSRDWGR